jgi:hypothetical protein
MFTDDIDGIAYFTPYFYFYNNVRLHGKIGYVTPAQRHCGEDKAILVLRKARLVEARKLRIQMNRRTLSISFVKEETRGYTEENRLTAATVGD